MKNKVIITCAITGGIHTPSLSDALPYTPADIAAQAIAAADAGAAILHLHARDPKTGAPTGNPDVYRQFLPVIKQATTAVINLTTGGSPDMSPDDRLAAALAFSPEMCSLNMGSMNFAFHGMGAKLESWKFPWEQQYIADSEKFIFRNTFADIARNYALLADHGTRFEHECYDIGHLYNLAHFVDAGIASIGAGIRTRIARVAIHAACIDRRSAIRYSGISRVGEHRRATCIASIGARNRTRHAGEEERREADEPVLEHAMKRTRSQSL